MKNVVQDLTSAGIDWQREKWQSGLGSKFIHQGEKNAAKYADEVIVLSKGVQDYFKETYGRETHFIRGLQNGYQRGYGTLKKLREMGMKDVGFGMTVQDKNAPDLVPLYKISNEMGMEFATASLHNSFYFVEAKNIIHDRPMVAKNFENLVNKKTGEELFYCSYCRAHKENGKELKAPAASVYKKVIDAMEKERREEEKMYSAIQQGAGRKAIEAVRADSSMQMKTILAELNMEQFRRVPLYECYMADEITEEQYHAEVLDYEEAHRKLNEQLTSIMENTTVWERALSLRNPWIQQMEQYKTPEALDRNFVKKYIEQVVVTFLGDRQAEISLTMKTQEWKQMLERIELEGTDDGTKK